MAEDFTTYTETDPGSRITITSSRVTFTAYGEEVGRVYKDKGANYFSGNFSFDLDINLATGITNHFIWSLANEVGKGSEIYNSTRNMLQLRDDGTGGLGSNAPLCVTEWVAGELGADSGYILIPFDTTRYIRLVRDESVGTYGTLYLYVYSDSARTVLVASESLALRAKVDFRYLYALNMWDTNAGTATGYVESLSEHTLPSVTTQQVTDLTATTATGNGNITDLGYPTATQHGHCWNTTGTPTTADSKTTNGVPAATGAFTSSITGLTSGTTYYTRAYITNTEGTAYGNQIAFTAGVPSGMIKGNLAIRQTRLHYIGTDGREYYIQGIPTT